MWDSFADTPRQLIAFAALLALDRKRAPMITTKTSRIVVASLIALGAFGVSAVVAATPAAAAPSTTWAKLSPATSPPARYLASMAYDPATGQLVLFGGYDGNTFLGDTWTWNGSTWAQQFPAASPPARQGASMAYDPATGQLVLFGGEGPLAGDYRNDTWIWNGSTWARLSPATSPSGSGRSQASMAYDTATNQLVLFGGTLGGSEFGDTWTWDGTSWAQLTPATSPPGRFEASMAYDPGHGGLVLYGGDCGFSCDDTWIWTGSKWRVTLQLPGSAPPERFGPSMADDPGIGRLVLFGGENGPSLNDTWNWDGTSWGQLSPADSPGARDVASMAYDSASGQLVLFGGYDGVNSLNDTWTYSVSPALTADSPPTTATVGSAYSYTFGATGSPTPTFSVASGTLPTGLTLSSAGVLSGVPSAAGTFTFSVQASNGVAPAATSPSITITVSPPPSPPSSTHGYWLVGGDGGIFNFGSAQFYGSTGSLTLQRPVVGISPTSSRTGYWLVASDGGIFAYGDAGFVGSLPGAPYNLHPAGSGLPNSLVAPVVGMVPSVDGSGYFMVASDGGVFALNAHFAGSCYSIGGCAGAAVAVVPDTTGNGYWVVTKTGNVYGFGDAGYYGGPGQGTVTSAVRTPDGKGYWILLANGEVFAYGDAAQLGAPPATDFGILNPASAIFATADGAGYWVSSGLGKVDAFGDAPANDGDMSSTPLNAPIIAATGW